MTLAYETWGTLNEDGSNAILVEHALTGGTHVTRGGATKKAGGSSSPGPVRRWTPTGSLSSPSTSWAAVTDPPGPASTAPDGKPWGSRFPLVTLRDSTAAEARLADRLGIGSWHAVVGGSMGGARALEWAVSSRSGCGTAVSSPSAPSSTAEQIAFAQAQTLAIRQDPISTAVTTTAGPSPGAGLALARRIAHITYRSAHELDFRFGRNAQGREDPLQADALADRGRYQVESYLDHQGNKLVRRFDANSYIALTEALMSHDVSRGRGTLKEALARTTADFFVAAVDSDRLYFPAQSLELAESLPGNVDVHMIDSPSATTASSRRSAS